MTDETLHASREATGGANDADGSSDEGAHSSNIETDASADSAGATSPGEDSGDPSAPQSSDKRRHRRAPLRILIQHRFTSLEEFISKYSSDLSMGGVFLRTESPAIEGSLVYLQFSLKSGEKLIEGLGQVVRVNPPGNPDGFVPGMGIEFMNFDDESLALIEEIVVERLQRHGAAAS